MKEQLEKDFKKVKKVIILEILGLFFSILFFVLFYLQKDNRYMTFIAVVALDIFDLQKNLKTYKALKEKLEK